MRYQHENHNHIIIIEKGESFIETLTTYCTEHGIENAFFRGIGAVDELECGYYALEEKQYYFTTYTELLEVAGLTGNVMLKDGKPFIHAHGVFTDSTNNAFGGHIKDMRVGVTLEVILTKLDSTLSRQLNDDIGLFLVHCPHP